MHRRAFVKLTLTAALGAASAGALAEVTQPARRVRRVLILGGTGFVGPAVVEAVLAAGHEVTLFNRGVASADAFPELETLRGFRSSDPDDEDLSALAHRHFDVAIDVWPNDPTVVASAGAFLRARVQHYMYISSIAAYDSRQMENSGITEDAPLEPWDGTGSAYNRGKAESERRLMALFGERLTVVRPGPIKGSRDTATNLLAWLTRAQSGGRHIGPGSGEDPVALVDVKDVARFLVLAIDRSLYGTFNLTGRPMLFREFLERCRSATHSEALFVWVPQAFLRAQGLQTDAALQTTAGYFPFWRPLGARPGLYQVSGEKAFRVGWQTRPFEETAWDCLGTFRSGRQQIPWQDDLSATKEQQVLAAWVQRVS